jgi:hypothetical protein
VGNKKKDTTGRLTERGVTESRSRKTRTGGAPARAFKFVLTRHYKYIMLRDYKYIPLCSRDYFSTWIDDLAFSGDKARAVIQVVVSVLKQSGLRLSHKKIKIMGSRQSKTLTGTRFGNRSLRAPKEICDRAVSWCGNS